MPTILVVDDEPTIRLLIRAALEGSGHFVLEATDGASALQMAHSRRPDLILLDIALPHLSGLEVCRRLREERATANTPILLLSGLVQPAERRAAVEIGAQGFIEKPFSPAALVEQVTDTLRPRAALTSR